MASTVQTFSCLYIKLVQFKEVTYSVCYFEKIMVALYDHQSQGNSTCNEMECKANWGATVCIYMCM